MTGFGNGLGRAWLIVLAVPLVLAAARAAGPLGAFVTAALALQLLVGWRWAPVVGAALSARFLIVWRWGRAVVSAAGVMVVRLVPAAVGCLVVLVAVDWGVGAMWDRATGPDGQVATVDLASARLPPTEDERVHSDAMADAPWADRYFAEMEALDWTYVPFIGPREAPVHGRFVNSAGGIRRSYEPPGANGEEALEVWFFGGSTLWGEGQRDRHTIPSAVARLAERDGVTLRVVNYGIRGYTAFQEFLVLEQELARRDPPDLAVFYHGFNELSTQTEAPENLSGQPAIFQLAVTADGFERAPPLPQVDDPGEPSVTQDYVETSAVHKLWRRAGSVLTIAPAAADEPFYRPPLADRLQAVDNAEAIYRRTLPLIQQVAREHGVPPVVFWQPALPKGQDPDYDELSSRVGDLGIDISDALDDAPAPIYIDGLHTNELGAQLSARAIWRHLAPIADGLGRP